MSNASLFFQVRLLGSHLGNKIEYTNTKGKRCKGLLVGAAVQRSNVSARLMLSVQGIRTPLLFTEANCQLLLKPISAITQRDLKNLSPIVSRLRGVGKVKLYKGFFIDTPVVYMAVDGKYDSIFMRLDYPLVAPVCAVDFFRDNGFDCGFEGTPQLIGTDYAVPAKTSK